MALLFRERRVIGLAGIGGEQEQGRSTFHKRTPLISVLLWVLHIECHVHRIIDSTVCGHIEWDEFAVFIATPGRHTSSVIFRARRATYGVTTSVVCIPAA